MTVNGHFDLELQDLLDGRLSDAEAARVQAHVATCSRCREELDVLRRGRDRAQAARSSADVPTEVCDRISGQLEAAVRDAGVNARRRRMLTYVVGATAAGIAAAIYVRRRPDIPADVIESYVAYRKGEKQLELTTAAPSALEQFFSVRLPFRTRVLDLAMMRYTLSGGRIDRIDCYTSALSAYVGPENRHLLCQMYAGSLAELPEPNLRRSQNGIDFSIYTRGAHTAVFWREADMICVVVSDMPAADTMALAFAKAIKV